MHSLDLLCLCSGKTGVRQKPLQCLIVGTTYFQQINPSIYLNRTAVGGEFVAIEGACLCLCLENDDPRNDDDVVDESGG